MKQSRRVQLMVRYAVVLMLILLLSGWIVTRMVETTVIDADRWNARAQKELNRTDTILPERGNILASDGSILATDLRFYTVRMDYRCEKFQEQRFRAALDTIADSMARYFPQRDAKAWRNHLAAPLEIVDSARPRAYRIITGLTNHQVEKMRTFPFFKISNPNKNGFKTESYMRRYNPYGDMARRSIGGVGATASSKQVHGISGLEKALDSMLYGQAGVAKKVALTRKIANWTDVAPVPGLDITTTIDISMQDIVENELNNVLDSCGADWGVAVLMDVHSGEIKAISNLELNPSGPGYVEARNRAVMGYEPGSVVKTLSMMLALDDGQVNLNEVLPTGSGWAYAGGRPITDAHHSASIRACDVIEQSSNIGMARIITRVYDNHPGGWYSRVKRLGFLEPMNTGIAGEVPPRFDSVPDDRAGRIAMSRMAYGYATEIPPLYTLALYNAIANGGEFVRPRLVKEIHGQGLDSILPVAHMGNGRACSERTAQLMRGMLRNVVWGPHGTGRSLRSNTVALAGKTGTCYMIENGTYNTAKKRLAFCGYFPADEPKYSCIVLTCHPTRNFFGAATTSGRVMRNIALKLYSRGMLGNSSDYRQGGKVTPQAPVFAASASHDAANSLRTSLAMPGQLRVLSRPRKGGKGVPDVKGLAVRDAIARMEQAGYNVDIAGSGHVASQSPAPGSTAPPGSKVMLRLTQ